MKWGQRRARRQSEDRATVAELGRAIGESLRGLSIRHDVTHHHDAYPQPVRAYAEISNMEGQIWRVAGYNMTPGQRDIALQGVPISFITGRPGDAPLGQANITIRFEYDR